jgi:4-amino-4-deoxy-L-arabinose transferase-like glycosyltransferase
MFASKSSLSRVSLGALAIGLALLAQQRLLANRAELASWGMLGVAAFLIAVVAREPGAAVRVEAARPPATRVWPRLVFSAVALGALVAVVTLSESHRTAIATVVLWAGGLSAASLAVRNWIVSPRHNGVAAFTTREAISLLLVILVAALVRLIALDLVPPRYFADEARLGMFLLWSYRSGVPDLFTLGWNAWPVLGITVQGAFVPLFGMSIATLRLASAVIGTLSVLTTYLLARELFTPRVALLAAFSLAIGRTAVEFSRLGICHIQVALFETLAFFFWWRAIRTGRATNYLWSGIGLALCVYGYNAGQLLPLLWIAWLVVCVVLAPRAAWPYRGGALLALAGFLFAAFPLLYSITDHLTFGAQWRWFTNVARNRQVASEVVGIWNAQGVRAAANLLVGRQIWWTWLGFWVFPAGDYGVGYRGGGMFDLISAPLFFLGLAMCVAQRRGPEWFLVFWCLVTTVVGGVLTNGPPAFVRLVGLLPAAAMLIALPLDWLMRNARQPAALRFAATTLVLALLAGAAFDNWRTYFGPAANFEIDMNSELVHELKHLPAGTPAYLLGSEQELHFNNELFRIELGWQAPTDLPDPRHLDVAEPAHFLPLHRPIEGPLALVLGPTHATLTAYVQSLYPRARLLDDHSRTDPDRRFRIFYLEPDVMLERTGLSFTVTDTGTAARSGIADPFSAPQEANGVREWSGMVYWPSDQPTVLAVSTSGGTSIELAGQTILHPNDTTARVPVDLARGWQTIRITEAPNAEHRLTLTLIGPNGQEQPLTRVDFRPDGTAQGLVATYERDGHTIARTIDPMLSSYASEAVFRPPNDLPFRMPFRARWEGTLDVPQDGVYAFESIGSGPFSVDLDGAPLLYQEVSPERPPFVYTRRRLSAGPHSLNARWDSSHPPQNGVRRFQLYWTPPGGQRALIPPSRFSPVPTNGAQP